MKIHKSINRKDKNIKVSYKECPVQNGDIIYIKKCKKEPRKRKVGEGWEVIPDVFDWWIKDYTKIEVGEC
jgi:DNA polymerase-3 subunit alpha